MNNNKLLARVVTAAGMLLASTTFGATLIQYWPLDGAPGATNAPNAVPGGATAVLVNADPNSAWINTGLPSKLPTSTGAVTLYGTDSGPGTTNDFINLGVPGIEENATVSLWINNANAYKNDVRFISPATDYAAYTIIGFDPFTSGNVRVINLVPNVWGNNGQTWSDIAPFDQIPAGTWTHLAFVFKSGTVTLYVDGVKKGSAPSGFNYRTSELNLGGKFRGTYGNSFSGSIDDVSIWNGPLSAQSIQKLASGVSPKDIVDVAEPTKPAKLVQYLPLDDGAGSAIATNAVAGGNPGSLTNLDAGAAWVSTGLAAPLTNSKTALLIDGGGYLNLGKIGLIGSGAVSMWLKPITNVNDVRIYVQLAGSTYNPGLVMFSAAGTNTGGLSVYNSAATPRIAPDSAVATNQWTHLVVSYDNGFATAFINGVPQITTKAVFAFDDDEFAIGPRFKVNGTPTYGRFFSGYIDDVSIWDAGLSLTSIQKLAAGVSPLAITDIVEPPPAPQLSFATTNRTGAQLTQYFPLEGPDTATNAVNFVATGNTGTLMNYFVPIPPWTNSGLAPQLAHSTSAVVMNGVANYANVGNISLTAPMSISMWIKPSSVTQGGMLFGQLSGPTTHSGAVGLIGSGALFTRGTSAARLAPDGTIPAGQWTHVAVVFDPSLTAYINGTNVFTSTNTCTFSTDPFGLGAPIWMLTAPLYQSFPGVMDDVSIWNGALSPENVQALATGTNPKNLTSAATLVHYYPLEGSDNELTVQDAVAGGTPGQLANYDFTLHSWDSSVVPPALKNSTRSLYLNGFGEYLKIGNINQSNSAAVSLWLKPNTLMGDQRLLSQLSGATTQQGHAGYSTNGQVWVWAGNVYTYPGAPGTLDTTQWHHLLFNFGGGTVTLYVDGVEKGTTTSGFYFKGPEMGIGSKWINQYGNSVSGYIDDVAIWDKPLAIDSVIRLSQGAAPNAIVDKPRDMVLSWPGYPGPYYTLQTATNIAGPWVTISPTTSLSGTQYTAPVPISEYTQTTFYRMIKP